MSPGLRPSRERRNQNAVQAAGEELEEVRCPGEIDREIESKETEGAGTVLLWSGSQQKIVKELPIKFL